MAYGGMVGFGEYFVGAYVVALGAGSFGIGLLGALSNLMAAAGNALSFPAARALGTRKRAIVLFAALQALMWLPIAALGLVQVPSAALAVVIFFALYTGFGALVAPCWNSVMSEVLPSRLRGRYFGMRSRFSTLSTVGASLVGGGLIFVLRDQGLWGYVIAFAAAFGCRAASALLLTTLFELHRDVRSEESVPLPRFLAELPRTNMGRAMACIMLMNLSVNLAGPQFTPYMLKYLGLNILTFTGLQVLTAVATVLTVTHWGATADRFGNRRLFAVSAVLVSLVPLLWLPSGNVGYLAFVQVYSGLAWAGFNLTSVNFLFDATHHNNRTAYLALFSAGAGLAGMAGALIGGAIAPHLPSLLGTPLLTLFALSGGMRLLAAFGVVTLVREVRKVSKASALEVFHCMVAGKPAGHALARGYMMRLHTPVVGHLPNGRPNGVDDFEWERARGQE
jgi:MFS family permease